MLWTFLLGATGERIYGRAVSTGRAGSTGRAVALVMVLFATAMQSARAQVWATADLATNQPARIARVTATRVSDDPVPAAREPAVPRTYVPRTYGIRTHDLQQAQPARASAPDAGASVRSLLDSYGQGYKDNCGSVALTKLVLALYGLAPASGPFSRRVGADGSVAVQLADGSMVSLTAQEQRQAAQESGMEAGEGNALEAANRIYAVLAVRLAQARDGRSLNAAAFARALKTLSLGGEDADEDRLAPLLGFAFDDRSEDNSAKQVFLLSSPLHVAFAFEGRYDEHGEEGGASLRNFRASYRDAGNDLMFRDFLETWHGADGKPVLVRQCSEAKAGWTPATAQWIPRSACAM